MADYIERHVLRYDPQEVDTGSIRNFLSEVNLGTEIYFHTIGAFVLRVPENLKGSVARLEERFGELIRITQEPLVMPQTRA